MKISALNVEFEADELDSSDKNLWTKSRRKSSVSWTQRLKKSE